MKLISKIISRSRERAIRSVATVRMYMYWNIGHKIFEEEQHEKDRAVVAITSLYFFY